MRLPGRDSISRIGRMPLALLAVAIAAATGCSAEQESQHVPQLERSEPPELPDLSPYDYAGLDTSPVPEPFSSICVRPRRVVGLWSDAITGPGARVPPLARFGRLSSEFETALRCVARTEEEKKVLLQRTELADSLRWYDPNWMVLVATYGFAPNIGRGVRIEFVTQDGDSLIAHAVKLASGGPGCVAMPEATYPISVVAIPASDANVVFREYLEVEPPCS